MNGRFHVYLALLNVSKASLVPHVVYKPSTPSCSGLDAIVFCPFIILTDKALGCGVLEHSILHLQPYGHQYISGPQSDAAVRNSETQHLDGIHFYSIPLQGY